jgi:hypothetical protein
MGEMKLALIRGVHTSSVLRPWLAAADLTAVHRAAADLRVGGENPPIRDERRDRRRQCRSGTAALTREGKMSLLVTMAPPAPPGSSRGHGEAVRRTDMAFTSINSNFRSDPVIPDLATIGVLNLSL